MAHAKRNVKTEHFPASTNTRVSLKALKNSIYYITNELQVTYLTLVVYQRQTSVFTFPSRVKPLHCRGLACINTTPKQELNEEVRPQRKLLKHVFKLKTKQLNLMT